LVKKRISKEKAREIIAGLEEKVKTGEIRKEVLSELVYPNKGKPCRHSPKNWGTLGCMQHDYKHVVGRYCNRCHVQWFFEDDWRTEECRQYKEGDDAGETWFLQEV